MKKILKLIMTWILILCMVGCQSDSNEENKSSQNIQTESNNVLVAYFSLYGNVPYDDNVDASTSASIVISNQQKYGATEYIANLIAQKTNADQYPIEVVNQYSTDFDDVRDRNHDEQDNETHPELKTSQLDMDKYDTIFLGYPVWATTVQKPSIHL